MDIMSLTERITDAGEIAVVYQGIFTRFLTIGDCEASYDEETLIILHDNDGRIEIPGATIKKIEFLEEEYVDYLELIDGNRYIFTYL